MKFYTRFLVLMYIKRNNFIKVEAHQQYQPTVYRMSSADDELYNILIESPNDISELLRSASHPVRVLILTLLLREDRSLRGLVEGTTLSKNALVNHLGLLIDNGLVQRVRRGRYNLTVDGEDLINKVASFYRDSAVREEKRLQSMRSRYTVDRKGDRMSEKVISKPAKYQPCWISYTGAMAGALKALGLDCDIADVGGFSGYAFITNVIKGTFCPSGPTAFHTATWEEIRLGTQDMGYELAFFSDGGGYPSKEGEPSPEDVTRARRLFERVKMEIDEDKPVVLWGLPIPEYGIVNGYRGSSYITSTYRSLIESEKPEEPVLYHELQAPGELHAIFFREPIEVKAEMVNKKVLERAHRFALGKIPVSENYVTGPDAFNEWVNALETVPLNQHSYHGNSYVAACLWESREMATEFLSRLVKKCSGQLSEHLMEASKGYAEAARQLKQFTEIFPFSMEGDMSLEKRRKGAEILKKVKFIEGEAIEYLRNALDEL